MIENIKIAFNVIFSHVNFNENLFLVGVGRVEVY